ncbi:MAG: SgcJ/EcaC family oxidoreductase [Planctomycetaceae bacterium]|nr:SgcJ/EcaC family oxidoreductase [Planctomycetaceae bacterium]
MKHFVFALMILLWVTASGFAKPPGGTSGESDANSEDIAIRERIAAYVEAFNQHDAALVASHWTEDGVSVAEATGERTEGREALQAEFEEFFAANGSARLSGQVSHVRAIRPDVFEVEGQTRLFAGADEPVESAFTAVLVKDGDQWMISSSHEHDLPQPLSTADALRELEWLVGRWEDQSDEARVTTTVRWSSNQAFLIRSFEADLGEGVTFEGTQVIGWDPLGEQIRTWTFTSDGSFGQGTVSRNDDAWMLKMWQVLSDGRLANATRIMTRVNDDTMTVETIGQTIDGEPVPSLAPVTVVRTGSADGDSDAQSSTTEGAAR